MAAKNVQPTPAGTRESSERTLTKEEAREILTGGGYDAYGAVRIYGRHGTESEFAGQSAAIKSVYHLDRGPYEEIWVVEYS